MGSGIPMDLSEIAFKCNFAYMNEETQVVEKRRVHRCGVKVSGPNLSDQITGTDPLKDNLMLKKVAPKNKDNPNAVFTAQLVND
jgi:2,3-bisphosphoglycerate-independent phosphoglycerate mutase